MTIKQVGSTFWGDVAAAVSTLDGIGFDSVGGLSFGPAVAPADIAAASAVYAAHDPAKTSPAEQYEAALAAGLAITSTATPSLNGTYRIDEARQAKITGIATGIAAGKGVPGNGATFNYLDAGGVPHAFTEANFQNFAKAIEDYVYALISTEAALAGGHAAAWPSPTATIA